MHIDITYLAFATAALLIGGIIKGYSGVGLPMIAIPALTLCFPIKVAIGLMAIPVLLANLLQAQLIPKSVLSAKWFILLSCSLVFGILCSSLLFKLSSAYLSMMLGTSMVMFSIISLTGHQFKIKENKRHPLAVVFGLFAGITGGSTSLYGWPLVIYISSISLPPRLFIASISGLYLVGHVGFMSTFWLEQGIDLYILFCSIASCLPVYLGIKGGQKIRERFTNPQLFYNLISILIFLAGCKLLLTSTNY